MKTNNVAVRRWALALLFVTPAVRSAFADETSERIIKVYKEAREQVQTAYVEFQVKSTNLLPMDVLAKYDIAAYLVDQTVTFAVGPEKHYFRELNHSGPPGLIMDRVQVWRPDGSVQERRPNPGFDNPNSATDVPMYYIEKADLSRGARFNCLYFNCICFDYPDVTRVENSIDRAGDRTPWRLDTVPMLLKRSGMAVEPGTTKLDGVPCVVARADKWQALWFDPAQNYALCKRELYEGGALKYEIRMKDFVDTSVGLRVPRSITYTTYATGEVPQSILGKPALRHEIKLTRLEVNNPKRDGLFTMKIEPGALVVDTTIAPVGSKGEIARTSTLAIPAVTYRQPASEADLNEVIDEARHDVGYWYESQNKGWLRLAAIALATSAVAAGVHLWRKQAEAPKPTELL